MVINEEDILEFEDPENYSYSKEESFSHPATSMKAYMRCIECGGKEMTKGYWESKVDKFGNVLKHYVSDSRLDFINAVETLKNVIIADIDPKDYKELEGYYNESKQKKEELLDLEEQWFNFLQPQIKKQITHIKGFFNQDLPFYQNFITFEVDNKRKIFECLEITLNRGKYLKRKLLIG
jgi:hypothetical protein